MRLVWTGLQALRRFCAGTGRSTASHASIPKILALLAVLAAAPPASAQQATGDRQPAGWVEIDQVGKVPKADLADAYVVTARALNVRSGPSLERAPISYLERGDVVRQLRDVAGSGEDSGWLAVQLPRGNKGWVRATHVQALLPAVERLEKAMRLVAAPSSPMVTASRRAPVEKLNVGFVLSAPIGDAGWTYSHNEGRKALETLPFVVRTSYVESVPEKLDDVLEAVDRLVADGANLIFTTSFGYMDPTLEAARRHPEVVFMHSAGFKTAPNVGTYFGRIEEARYLAGMVAGGASESGIIGYVAAFPIAQVIRGINAFALGALSVNPNVEVRVLWTSNWYAPGLERETADRLMDFGADVVTMHQNSPAVVQAAEQRGKYAIGYHSDMSMFGPNAALTSASWNWAPLYKKIAQDVHDGTWQPYQLLWGVKEGVVQLAPLNPMLPDSLRERVLAAEQALRDGRLRLFEGTIRDSSGVVRVPAGKVASDAELLSMDYFVLGVKGELPPPKPPAASTN